MLSRAQNTFHHNPRLRGPVSSIIVNVTLSSDPYFNIVYTARLQSALLI